MAKSDIVKKYSLLLIWLLAPIMTFAQEQPEIKDFFQSYNKIYVVVLVLTTILIGLFLVLIFLERKIKKIERDHHSGR